MVRAEGSNRCGHHDVCRRGVKHVPQFKMPRLLCERPAKCQRARAVQLGGHRSRRGLDVENGCTRQDLSRCNKREDDLTVCRMHVRARVDAHHRRKSAGRRRKNRQHGAAGGAGDSVPRGPGSERERVFGRGLWFCQLRASMLIANHERVRHGCAVPLNFYWIFGVPLIEY